MKKLTALSLALLLALFPAATGSLAMEQLHPPAHAEEGTVVSPEEPKEDNPPVQPEAPEEDSPPTQTEAPEEENPSIQTEEPEEENSPTQTEAPEGENPPTQTEEPEEENPSIQTEEPEEENPPTQTEAPEEENPSIQPEEPEEENPPIQPEEPEEENPPIQPEEVLPQPPVWTEVSTIDALCAAGGSAGHIRLTADLTVSDPDLQFYTFWTPTTLDMNGHSIQIEAGGWLSFGGGSTPLVILGDGGEEGAFRVVPGGRLDLEDVDVSQFAGLLARQAEGGWLTISKVTVQPEQIVYAQAPVLYQLRASFAVLPLGLSQEELAAQLPDPEGYVNYQGQISELLSVPAGRLSWDIEKNWENISAGRRTLLHARPNGPITGENWPESELIPTLFAPVSCELAILVDGAAIGQIIDHHTVQGSFYELYLLFPDRVQPEGLPRSEERGPACLEFSLDAGETWLSVTAGGESLDTDLLYAELYDDWDKGSQEPYAQLGFYQMNVTFSVRAWADYQGEGYTLRLYTDTLTLSPEGVHIDPGIGGSRGGTVELLPTPPDPPEPVTPPLEETDPPEPVTPPMEETAPPEPVTPPVEGTDPTEPVTPPVEGTDPPEPVSPPVEGTDPPEPVTPPMEEIDPPEPVTPPVEETDPPEPVTPPVEETDPPEPVTFSGTEHGVQPAVSPEGQGTPADPAPHPAQTTPPDSQTQHTAAAPSPRKQTTSALPSPVVQVLAGTAVTVTLVAAAVAAKPATILNWLRRLFYKL